MWRGFLLRCPACAEGRMSRSLFGINTTCTNCGADYELGRSGEWSGAIMIAQMVTGLLAIPVFIALTVWTDLSFTLRAWGTLILLTLFLVLSYRNFKGLWYGWLWRAQSLG